MAFIRMAFFPGGNAEHYAALEAELGDAPHPTARLAFFAGPRDGGWQVVQVWEDAARLEEFNARWLFPAFARLGSAGFPQPPTVTDFEATEIAIQAAR